MNIIQVGDVDGNNNQKIGNVDTTQNIVDNFSLKKQEEQNVSEKYEFTTRDELINKQSEILEKMKDPLYLPTSQEIYIASRQDTLWYSYLHNLTNNGAVYVGHYLIINKEFIDTFSDYLVNCITTLMEQNQKQPIKILEVGAGNGRLSYFLEQALEKKIPGKFSIIATDSFGWSSITKDFAVEKKDAITAVKGIKPNIVIASFVSRMDNPENDWTPNTLDIPNLKEYILIGPEGPGWEHRGHKTPQGFIKKSLHKITETQICLHDEVERKDLNNISRIKSDRGTLSYKRKVNDKPLFIIKKS